MNILTPVKKLLFLPKAQNLVSKTLRNTRNSRFKYVATDKYHCNPAKIKKISATAKLRPPRKPQTVYL